MITKLWKDNRRELDEAERLTVEEIMRQAGGDQAEALSYAAVSLRAERLERERLWEIIKDQRLVIQRLQFPRIYPPNSPLGAEEVAREIYALAAHVVELMEREGMEEEYEVTYNSMREIASMGELNSA